VRRVHKTTVRFGDETYASLSARARREGIPVSHMIREAVVVYIALGVRPSSAAELRTEVDDHELRIGRIEKVLGGARS